MYLYVLIYYVCIYFGTYIHTCVHADIHYIMLYIHDAIRQLKIAIVFYQIYYQIITGVHLQKKNIAQYNRTIKAQTSTSLSLIMNSRPQLSNCPRHWTNIRILIKSSLLLFLYLYLPPRFIHLPPPLPTPTL